MIVGPNRKIFQSDIYEDVFFLISHLIIIFEVSNMRALKLAYIFLLLANMSTRFSDHSYTGSFLDDQHILSKFQTKDSCWLISLVTLTIYWLVYLQINPVLSSFPQV